jgi:hypothetical protein
VGSAASLGVVEGRRRSTFLDSHRHTKYPTMNSTTAATAMTPTLTCRISSHFGLPRSAEYFPQSALVPRMATTSALIPSPNSAGPHNDVLCTLPVAATPKRLTAGERTASPVPRFSGLPLSRALEMFAADVRPWGHDDSVRTLRVVLAVAASVAVLSALAFALTPASGTFDSESYTCGTAFHFDAQGYEGAPGFTACDEERKSRRLPALGLLALSGLLVVSVPRLSRHQSV